MFKSVLEGYLTEECKECEYWKDNSTEIGCFCPEPIDHCDAFREMKEKDKYFATSMESLKIAEALINAELKESD